MSHQRTSSTIGEVKEPHSVSLKVLRLSRPSLSLQNPLPQSTRAEADINPAASLAYPAENGNENGIFILAPVLELPPAFGSAYVGETFSCTLCANNELLVDQEDPKRISGVTIEAKMKTPTTTISLLPPATDNDEQADQEKAAEREKLEQTAPDVLEPAQSLQNIISYHLKEEGNHVLSVTVSYNETGATSGRVRTFRKLYQFAAKPCMVVRTKTGALPDKVAGEKRRKKWALEAQLENVGDESIVLDTVSLDAKSCFSSTSLNWDMHRNDNEKDSQNPILNPNEIHQVCFLVEANGDIEMLPDGRLIIGQLNIEWRTKMGDRGFLSTGWLGTRLKVQA